MDLEQPGIGLGHAFGYSGADLTGVWAAHGRGEVSSLCRPPGAPLPVLEIRVHGVGGASAETNLETPSTLQVAGDSSAGFYRSWYPGSRAPARTMEHETYCWGKLDYAGWVTALWGLLLPFALVNLAHWMLLRVDRSWESRTARAALRLLALALTASFVATLGYVLVDLVAWQAAAKTPPVLPHAIGLLAEVRRSVLVAAALAAVLLAVGVLWELGRRTNRNYERWDGSTGADGPPGWRLAQPRFWDGEQTLVRQRCLHVCVGTSVVTAYAGLPHSSWGAFRTTAWALASAYAAVAVVLSVLSGADRTAQIEGWSQALPLSAYRALAASSTVVAGVAVVVLACSPSRSDGQPMRGDRMMQDLLVLVEVGLVCVVALAGCVRRQWRHQEGMLAGFAAPVVALLAVMVASIFSATLLLLTSNVLGKPKDAGQTTHDQLGLPYTVFASGVAFLAVAVVAVLVLAVLPLGLRLLRSGPVAAEIVADYDPTPAHSVSRRAVAKVWARARLTDYLPYALATFTVVACVAFVADLWLVHYDVVPARRERDLGSLGQFGALAAAAVTAAFVNQVRRALVDTAARKKVSLVWDVITFWPRAVHPLAPPSYAERSVPELVTRIRRIVGAAELVPRDPAVGQQDTERGRCGAPEALPDPLQVEPHVAVLLTGYSQGSPISVAVMAQLPAAVRAHTALLTLAAPVSRLYGRAFPAWFGQDQLRLLRDALTEDGVGRWTNLARRSDYIGGLALTPGTEPAVDAWVHDPPVLWTDASPVAVPVHAHSDWFSDPQTYAYADRLAEVLRARAASTSGWS
ncbi:hypothetical protein CLV35_3718 [Motilibacter peucedani]|uniref:Uncharacterized protein n=1 Tax=Motilibacter peucedani TaxID=598650 RepID=A0A420XKI2_9ACTN|nr:hypothetical protein [Motilibacter peucedani]RKS68589.1 hypothetical protein CLV35_3718 [Motilibacter peucedani]